ncbi:deoxyhypusine synthase family protein [Candidatus Sumerlaeota bacterium]|nr:deoxyhypusine synthase family protein [Candidatus Sumerlaeota bacterium]
MSETQSLRERAELTGPVTGMVPSEHTGCDALLAALGGMSFQARTLSRAAEILTEMCAEPGVFKVLTLAGALIPGGLKRVLMEMVSEGMVDVIISTGANVSHDLVEGMGHHHWQRCNLRSDTDLRDAFINRVYDTYITDDAFQRTALAMHRRLGEIAGRRTSPEICAFAGEAVTEPCLLSTARERGVPIFIPALNDSELGLLINSFNSQRGEEEQIIWDGLSDNMAFAEMMREVEVSGIVICGGGVPRNWAQQVTPLLEYLHVPIGTFVRKFPGYRYGIHITTDTPVYGGMSGCTISESISWGKYDPRNTAVTVKCDVTIALPLIVAAVIERLRSR